MANDTKWFWCGNSLMESRSDHSEHILVLGETKAIEPEPEHRALIAAAPDLLEAAQKVYAHLIARIDASPSTAKPVFDGIAELHDAIGKATSPTAMER